MRLVLRFISKRRARIRKQELNRVKDLLSIVKTRLREIRAEGRVEIHERVDLRLWTVLRVGGLADLLVRCGSVFSVEQVLGVLASHGLPWLVLGAGSRIVPSDAGLRIPAVHLTGEVARWEVEGDGLVSGAGAKLAQVCGSVARAGHGGLEDLSGRSGSVGGAVRSAMGGELRDLLRSLDWVEIVRPGGGIERLSREEPGSSGLELPGDDARTVVVRARLGLREERPTAARAPGAPPRAASPVFLDPPRGRAEDLLEIAGCKGLSVGGARVADWSANAIITTRTSSAREIGELCLQMRHRVLERSGIRLSPGLRFIDEHGRPG
jgi:UDP-N-acetylmuramate dehydrogenase